MKIYVHLKREDGCTLICRVGEDDRVEALLRDFCARYRAMFGRELETKGLTLRTAQNVELQSKKRLGRVLTNLDDVFLSFPDSVPNPPAASTSSAASTTQSAKNTQPPKAAYENSPLMVEFIKRGEREEEGSRFRNASELYQRVLRGCAVHKEALVHLMALYTRVGKPEIAAKWCETCLSRYSDDLTVLVAAGNLKHAAEEYDAAIQIFNKAINLRKRQSVAGISVQDVEILAAKSMYAAGEAWENTAVQLVMSVVEPERTHFEGLLLYARVAYDRGLIEDAVRVFLRLVLQKQEHEETKRYLADCFKKPGTFDFVVQELKTGPGLGSAYAFLAARIKDYGAVESAVQLYEKALDVDAEDPSIALNYVHTLELLSKTDAIIEFSKAFMNICHVHLIRALECKEIGSLLEEMPRIEEGGESGWLLLEMWQTHEPTVDVEEIVETVPLLLPVEFSEIQLDLLALLFTVVKVLYIGGALERAYKAIQLIYPCCEASAKKLHTTTVRNEAAYFNCIRQILQTAPPEKGVHLEGMKPLYLCGDSHCLSGAWQSVQLRGENHLLIPKLVTGCKVWHLRKESRFYPKVGFDHTMQSIPKRASVILMFGEIDCRTGIGLAVEKLKYESQAAAIRKTVGIYVQVIKELLRDRQFTIYVHPVPPALDVTRQIVKAYNETLKATIRDLETQVAYAERVFWLDFFDDLLTEDGKDLKPDLKFDETHLAPSYTDYLRQALLKCHPT